MCYVLFEVKKRSSILLIAMFASLYVDDQHINVKILNYCIYVLGY